MAIAVEVARVAGWRETHFSGINCRDIPAPPEPTLSELLDNAAVYARIKQEELSAELGLPREPTLKELLDEAEVWVCKTRESILADRKKRRKCKKEERV